jgi:hypothetical protein
MPVLGTKLHLPSPRRRLVQVRAFGGVRNCATAFAYEFGEHPDITAERMRSARRAVAILYGRDSPGVGEPVMADRSGRRADAATTPAAQDR